MPRPLHHWKSFWFGLLVVAFLGWSWARSMGRRESINWFSPGTGIVGALQIKGRLIFMRIADGSIVPARVASESTSIQRNPSDNWFPPHCQIASESDGQILRVSVAHWFLILLFLIPWSAFLLWRHRRMKRLAALLPAAHD